MERNSDQSHESRRFWLLWKLLALKTLCTLKICLNWIDTLQNAIWQNAARQMKRQEMERPSNMGQASGPSPVHFMQGSPQVRFYYEVLGCVFVFVGFWNIWPKKITKYQNFMIDCFSCEMKLIWAKLMPFPPSVRVGICISIGAIFLTIEFSDDSAILLKQAQDPFSI